MNREEGLVGELSDYCFLAHVCENNKHGSGNIVARKMLVHTTHMQDKY